MPRSSLTDTNRPKSVIVFKFKCWGVVINFLVGIDMHISIMVFTDESDFKSICI